MNSDTIRKYINLFTGDYLSIYDNQIINLENIKEVIDYNMYMLSLVLDKAFYKKNVYEEFIRQIICEEHPEHYGHYFNNFKDVNRADIVEELKKIPFIEQRSPEWFKLKEGSIGASEGAVVFGKNMFSSEKKLILKKCGYKEEFKMNPACLHGTKCEPIVQLIYEIKTKKQLYEFGSIRHPEIDCVSASPDGIMEDGVMVEIKVPSRRKITGIPPIYYWIQMQQQMQVCGLDKVDFVECKITEYLSMEEYKNDYDITKGDNYPFNNEGNIKNVFIEYHNTLSNVGEVGWIYPKRMLFLEEISQWIDEKKEIIKNDNNKIFSRKIFYKVDKYSVCGVWRDNYWWNTNKHKYKELWDKVLYHRKNGYDELLPKKRERKKRVQKFMFLDDSDDEK